jgi:hypothetical protein
MRPAALSTNTCSSTVILFNVANKFSDNRYLVTPLLGSSILSTCSDSKSAMVANKRTQASVEMLLSIVSPVYSSINRTIGEFNDVLSPLAPIGISGSSPSTIVSNPVACMTGLGLTIVSVSAVDSRDNCLSDVVAVGGNALTVMFEVAGLDVEAVRLKVERGEDGFMFV